MGRGHKFSGPTYIYIYIYIYIYPKLLEEVDMKKKVKKKVHKKGYRTSHLKKLIWKKRKEKKKGGHNVKLEKNRVMPFWIYTIVSLFKKSSPLSPCVCVQKYLVFLKEKIVD